MPIKQLMRSSWLMFKNDNENKGVSEQRNKGQTNKNSAQAALIRIVAWTIATVIVFFTVYSKDVFHSDPCEAPLIYLAENLNAELAIEKLQLRENTQTQATILIKGAAEKLVEQSQQLCTLYQQGRIENQVYVERQNGLSRQFAALVQLQKNMPAFSVGEEQLADYREKIAQISG